MIALIRHKLRIGKSESDEDGAGMRAMIRHKLRIG